MNLSEFNERKQGKPSTGLNKNIMLYEFIPTVIVNEHVSELPASSVASHMMVFSPVDNVLPDEGEHSTVSEVSMVSVAAGVFHEGVSVLANELDGHVIDGAS